MNGVRKVSSPDESLLNSRLQFLVRLSFTTSTKYDDFSLDTSKGLWLVRVTPDFPPVELSHTHFPPVNLDFTLTDFPPTSSEVVLTPGMICEQKDMWTYSPTKDLRKIFIIQWWTTCNKRLNKQKGLHRGQNQRTSVHCCFRHTTSTRRAKTTEIHKWLNTGSNRFKLTDPCRSVSSVGAIGRTKPRFGSLNHFYLLPVVLRLLGTVTTPVLCSLESHVIWEVMVQD